MPTKILAHALKLIIGSTIFPITYTTTTPLIGAINKTDIQNLKELGLLSHPFNLLLNLIEKLKFISQKA